MTLKPPRDPQIDALVTRDRHRRDTAKLHVGALLALCGSLLLVLMLGGYR